MAKKSKNKLQPMRKRLAVAADRLTSGDSWRAQADTTSARGYGAEWQRARLEFLDANPLCRHCRERSIITSATVVDHIEPHNGIASLFWNRNNWQALCAPCHNGWKQAREWQARYGR